MTPAVMQDLEAWGLIIRLCPNHHDLAVQKGEAAGRGDGRPGSFYVTEPCDMGRQLTDLGPYELALPV